MPQDTNYGFRLNYPMTKILDRLFLSGFKNAQELAIGNPHEIFHVCNCTAEQLNLPKNRFEVIQMNQLDGHDWDVTKLYSALEWVRRRLLDGNRVLVNCHAGISRSPVFTAAYLYTCGFDFDKALDQIKLLRPIVQPAPAVLISAKRAFGINPVA
jgi:protein-tyrosine phosphatase